MNSEEPASSSGNPENLERGESSLIHMAVDVLAVFSTPYREWKGEIE
jgi:hypothetical protein